MDYMRIFTYSNSALAITSFGSIGELIQHYRHFKDRHLVCCSSSRVEASILMAM
jgi:hypothetical protein